jgi:hypothetical protein
MPDLRADIPLAQKWLYSRIRPRMSSNIRYAHKHTGRQTDTHTHNHTYVYIYVCTHTHTYMYVYNTYIYIQIIVGLLGWVILKYVFSP